MRRFHLYTPDDDGGEMLLVGCKILSDKQLGPSPHHYVFKVGIASSSGVDYYGEYDGSKKEIKANTPYTLLSGGGRKIPSDGSAVLDVWSKGLPPTTEGVTIQTATRHRYTNPAARTHDKVQREVMSGVADHLNLIRAGDRITTLALPTYIEQYNFTDQQHEDDDTAQAPASATFVNGLVSIVVGGSVARPIKCIVTAHATFEGTAGGPGGDVLGIAINDGSTDQNQQQQGVVNIGEIGHVSTSYAARIGSITTFTLRVRDVTNTTQVNYQSISAIASES